MRRYIKYMMAGLVLVLSACSDFLDINTDPNNPIVAPVTQLLPAVEVRLALALGHSGLSNTASYLIQQNVTRGNLNDYEIQPNNVQFSWNVLYQDCLTDLREMERIATEKEYHNYVGVSKILRAYIYSILVDLWGDVPFSNAVQGSSNSQPTFDNGADIYNGIFAMLDDGIAELAKPVTFQLTKLSQGGDLIYGEKSTITQSREAYWRKFAKTLKLKLYNQVRLTRNVSAEVNALVSEGDMISAQVEDFELAYGSSNNPDDRHPTYPGQYSTASKTPPNPYFYEVMKGIDRFQHGGNIFGIEDPRVPYYFYRQLAPGANAQNHPCSYMHEGHCMIYSFSYQLDPREGFDQSASSTVQGLYPIGGRYDDGTAAKAVNNGFAKTPQRMLTFFARKFIEAELALTAGLTGDPAVMLEAAIRASFAKVNQVAAAASAPVIAAGVIDNYVAEIMALYDDADDDKKLQIIMTQKWIASYGFAVDAYTDLRRTGYPILHDGNNDSPPSPASGHGPSVTVRTRDYIVSFPYPDPEVTLNSNAPNQRNPYLDKVFWDR